jgi:hypothetical protein
VKTRAVGVRGFHVDLGGDVDRRVELHREVVDHRRVVRADGDTAGALDLGVDYQMEQYDVLRGTGR